MCRVPKKEFHHLYFIVGKPLYPTDLEAARCSRSDIRSWAEEAKAAGINYIGLCCGNASFYFRELAEAYGRKPPTSKYTPNVGLSHIFGKTSEADKYKRSTKIKGFMIGKDNA